MLRQIIPRLRKSNAMLNSFSSCISNAFEKFSWAPEMPLSKVFSQPRMFLQNFESAVPFKQLQCSTNRHCWRQFNKQMDMVNSDVKFIDFASMFNSNFMDESLTISFESIELKTIHSVFNFPHKAESILPEFMAKGFQIHFLLLKVERARKLTLTLCVYFKKASSTLFMLTN
mgnify:CR=1 FL=1